MAKIARLGIYGGTFDPPHKGHLHAASAFLACCSLDALYIVPTGTPPHKDDTATTAPEMRMDMVRLAFGDPAYADPRINVSDFEQRRTGKSYTYHTLCHFKDAAETIYLLCGEDMFLTLDNWYRAENLFALASIVCFRRSDGAARAKRIEDAAKRYERVFGARILLPRFTPLPISSTEIRHKLQNGISSDAELTENVQMYIKEHKLYQS